MTCDSCDQGNRWLERALDRTEVYEICLRQWRKAHELCERGNCDCIYHD